LKDYLNYSKLLTKITAKYLFLLFIFFVLSAKISAQIQPQDSNNVKIDTAKFEMKKSAWGAVLRSAVIPGFGQFYNESYWKIPVVWGFLGWFGYQWVNNNNLYIKYRDLYSESVSKNLEITSYYNLREFYKDNRDLLAFFIGLTYFLNLVDAYVDAHLFDFSVSNLTNTKYYQVSLKIKF